LWLKKKQLLRCFSSLHHSLGFYLYRYPTLTHTHIYIYIIYHMVASYAYVLRHTYESFCLLHSLQQPAEILIKITLSLIMSSYTLTILLNHIHTPIVYPPLPLNLNIHTHACPDKWLTKSHPYSLYPTHYHTPLI